MKFLVLLMLIPFVSLSQENDSLIFGEGFIVDPVFPGGVEALNAHINEKIEFNFDGSEAGTVYIRFVVDTTGVLNEIHVVNGVSKKLDAAAINVVKSMPNWIPGKQYNNPIAVTMTLPIRFELRETEMDEIDELEYYLQDDFDELEPEFPVYDDENEVIEIEDEILPAQIEINNKGSIIDPIEEDPEFPGGIQGLTVYLENNLQYPENETTEGVVYVSFTVDASGAVKNVSIKKGLTERLNNEAIRLVREMPKWTPAIHGTEIISVNLVIPVHFKLD